MVTFLEGTFDLFFFFRAVAEDWRDAVAKRLWQRDTIIGIFGAVTKDWVLEVWYKST